MCWLPLAHLDNLAIDSSGRVTEELVWHVSLERVEFLGNRNSSLQ